MVDSPPDIRLAKLAPFEADALTILAALHVAQTVEEWTQWAKDAGVEGSSKKQKKTKKTGQPLSTQQMVAVAERLTQLGLVTKVDSRPVSYRASRTVAGRWLPDAHAKGRLLPMWESMRKAFVPALRGDVAARRRYFNMDARVGMVIGELRVSLVIGSQERVEAALRELEFQALDRSSSAELLQIVLGPEPPDAWVDLLPGDVLGTYVGEFLEYSLHMLDPLPASLPRWVERANHRRLRLGLARLMALRGEPAAATKLGKLPKWGLESVELIGQFAAGDYGAAAELGDAATAAMKTRKYPQLGELEGLVHALTRIVTMDGDGARTAGLRASLEHWEQARVGYPESYAALAAFDRAILSTRSFDNPPHALSLRSCSSMSWQQLLVTCLCIHWLGLPLHEHGAEARVYLQAWQALAEANGYPAIAREMAALLALANHLEPEGASLATAYKQRQRWEMILDTLESSVRVAQVGASAGAGDGGFREHIVWEVALGQTVVDIKAKLISSARSRKGKDVPLPTLLSGKIECLTDADRRVIASAEEYVMGWHPGQRRSSRGSGTFYLSWDALVALIDHPRVRRASGNPVRFTRGQPTIRTQTKDGVTTLELVPAQLASQPVVHKEIVAEHVEVFVQDPDLAALYGLFAHDGELKIPSSGRARLLDSLAGLATSAAVQIEGESELRGRSVDADARIVLQLQWNGSTFVACVKVAPLGPEGPHFVPGDGPVKMVARVGEEMLSCTRDPAQESRSFEALLEACPSLASQPEDEGRWDIHDLDTALEILLELHALADEVTLTWPKGRTLSLPRELSAKDMRLAVKSQADWLQVDVELGADEGLVLGFKELLAKRRGAGRFIALGDDRFLALTTDLRKRIDALENLGTLKKAKLAVHPVCLPMLEQIIGDQAVLQADKKARARLDSLRELATKTPRVPRGFQATLRDYQREGFVWMARLAEAGLGAVLADDMGLGKTIQALALLCKRSKTGPALVVAPTSVVSNWLAEAERFAPRLRCHLLAQAAERVELLSSLRGGDLLVCSYGLLVSEAEALAELSFGTVVFDEAHALKNSRSLRSKAACALSSGFRLSLTGTPIENHLGELWSVFQATVPGLLGSQQRFEERFARPISQGQRERARQLRAMVRPFMLRRTKAQVLDELPPRTEVTIRVTPGPAEKAFYEALRREAIEQTRDPGKGKAKAGSSRLQILAQITKLRQAAVDPRLVDPDSGPAGAKIEALIRRLIDLREEGHRALVFTQFLGSMATIRERLDEEGIRYLGFDGSTPAKQRATAVEAFQAGEGDVFVMSLKAGGVGINLTGADYVIHLDPWWNPAVEDQATGRAHRIGQQRPVTVYRLVTAGTIEEQILELHGTKRDLADDLLAGLDSAKKLDLDELRALLRG